MHGSFWKSFCLDCDKEFSYDQIKEKLFNENVPKCACGGVVKPDIVFFGENVKYFSQSTQLATRADLFFIIGSSCVVQPAACVPNYANGPIVVVNKEEIGAGFSNIALEVTEDIDTFFKEVAQELNITC